MGAIKILRDGFFTTIQDLGRYGYQQFGVPVSGVMDSFSHRVGNILVGNHEDEASLEVTMVGPVIKFLSNEVIAITGGNLGPQINEKDISMYENIKVKKGDILSFKGIVNGCRSYICFTGGIDILPVMGSRSTYVKGKIGGIEGRKLAFDDVINIKTSTKEYIKRKVPLKYIPKYLKETKIRVIMGPQLKEFTSKGIRTFLQNSYEVTNNCDRMGYRLEGETIEHKIGADIISDGISFGAIQIPGHGKPIIMMADRQTTGGYTKIATVISSDTYKIAQMIPGDRIRFKEVDIYEAHKILKEEEEKLENIKHESHKSFKIKTRYFNIKIRNKNYKVKVHEKQ